MLSLISIIYLSYPIVPNNAYCSNMKPPKLIFFTGGNSLMPEDIYSTFITKLKSKYDVSVIKNSYIGTEHSENSMKVLEKLYEYSLEGPIIPIGHSSGCTTLLNFCSKLKNIEHSVLLDPVDNNINENEINYNKFKSVLQIKAEKSYKWKYNNGIEFFKNPLPKVPFIPAFSLDTSKFNNITTIEIKDYGHCDILDTTFSNLMHNSIAEGTDDRESLDNYKNFLMSIIDIYANDLLDFATNHDYLVENSNGIKFEITNNN